MTIQLDEALAANREKDDLDFKESFDVHSKGEWLEIIKDIVAMANSGGGILLIGVTDDGKPSNSDVLPVLNLDTADITNKVFAYTGHQFSNFTIRQVQKSRQVLAAIVVGDTRIPIVFTKPGNYQTQSGKQKSAFSIGSLYFGSSALNRGH
jgi:predicted HTH transcriptional regulator